MATINQLINQNITLIDRIVQNLTLQKTTKFLGALT